MGAVGSDGGDVVETRVGALAPDRPNADALVADLYRTSRAGLVRTAAAIVGSGAVAEELVNDAFIRLRGRLDDVDAPGPYVRRIVVNLALRHLRRRRLERSVLVHPPASTWPAEIDETWSAICRLPPRQRAVLALRFYEDMSEPAIAAALGCPVGTVKSTLNRGLDRLRKELS